MPVKRALRLEDKKTTPLKRPALEKTFSPLTGTHLMSPVPATPGNYQASEETTSAGKAQSAPQKKLEKLRSNLEKSAQSILNARQDLESQLPLEGSSELKRLFSRGTGDLLKELEEHRKLVDKVESSFAMGRMRERESHFTGLPPAGNLL
ncbi:uncharacterized protein LOC122133210 [Clupea harengus]|uniref:Uncharacterized protein LOC122133210 n=1 Tax=Clupea harengus TaxID=7950 RepID=A0A8M1KSY2_CLUHA|nr:uncharacterized protein LOC122133210 [Clupea harengus]